MNCSCAAPIWKRKQRFSSDYSGLRGITDTVALLEHLVNPLLSQQVLLHVFLPYTLTSQGTPSFRRRRCGVHPIELLYPFPPRRFLLQPLQLCQLSLFLDLFLQLIQFLLLIVLWATARYRTSVKNRIMKDIALTYRFLFDLPHSLLICQ